MMRKFSLRHTDDPTASTVIGRNFRTTKLPFVVRFEVFTAITIKNASFWGIQTQFIPHMKHVASPLQSTAGYYYVRVHVFITVTMRNAIFLDIKSQFVPHRKHISPLQIPAG
jgi:hypothetical protein